MILCEACERGDHANCGRQTWCQCDCDPDAALPELERDPYDDARDPLKDRPAPQWDDEDDLDWHDWEEDEDDWDDDEDDSDEEM